MKWIPATTPPTLPGRYFVRLTWRKPLVVASWHPETGWIEGARKLLHVAAWRELTEGEV